MLFSKMCIKVENKVRNFFLRARLRRMLSRLLCNHFSHIRHYFLYGYGGVAWNLRFFSVPLSGVAYKE